MFYKLSLKINAVRKQKLQAYTIEHKELEDVNSNPVLAKIREKTKAYAQIGTAYLITHQQYLSNLGFNILNN